jgi:hypothetical protein
MALRVRPGAPGSYSVFDVSTKGYRQLGSIVNWRRGGKWHFKPAPGTGLPELDVTAAVHGPAASLTTAIDALLSPSAGPLFEGWRP